MLAIGIDVGGTFTDFVVFDEDKGQITVNKYPTSTGDPTDGVMKGLRLMNIDLSQVRRIVHGTTVATNATLERKGAKTAALITKGFADVIEFGMVGRYAGRGYPGGHWNPYWVRPKPFVPRPLRFEVTERVSPRGNVLTPLDERQVTDFIHTLRKEEIEAVAVCFLNSYVNPAHEKRVGELLRKNLPRHVAISLSAETVPEFREFERWATTVLNAYVAPCLREYLKKLSGTLHKAGYRGEIFYMISSGGIVTESTAADYPIRFILSGPAGGVAGGVFLGEMTGYRDVITCDMGGTSTDVSLIKNLTPAIAKERLFENVPIKTPQLDIATIGAGGGSQAWVDGEGALKVGPQSAGAVPGPVAYGKGGTAITVTDANLILGRLASDSLLKGRMKLDRDLAVKAIESLSRTVKVPDIYQLAEGIINIAVTKMCGVVRTLSIERGYDPRDFVLVPMGGAGPMHAVAIAEELGLTSIVVPNNPGNSCAFGILTSDLKHDYVRPYVVQTQKADIRKIRSLFKEMADQGVRALREEGVPSDRIAISYSADMRYAGQLWELNAPARLGSKIAEMEKSFHQQYYKAYGYSRENMEVELVCLRVLASGRVDKPTPNRLKPERRPLAKMKKGQRQVYFRGRFMDTPIYDRDLVTRDTIITGPAVVEELGATTVLFPGWRAKCDAYGNLIVTRTRATRKATK
ncbi:MAG: hydantoinase/oxoprolinase family protein [Chloroflexi bacterium]|nr:hydantoinase/oxoprolinase family protein [Chloroflexota bacterium]